MSNVPTDCPEALYKAVARVSDVLRKLATAASEGFGADCFLHMELGQVLLADLGVPTQRVLGFAAWRVGHEVADCLANHPLLRGFAAHYDRKALSYHAWLECDDWIVDFTTYQLAHKALQLDGLDGTLTTVAWCPPYLLCRRSRVCTFDQVREGAEAGSVYYEARPEYSRALDDGEPPDMRAVFFARMLLKNPNLHIVGPGRSG